MPFKSEKQRRFMWAQHPDIAKKWAHSSDEERPKKSKSKDDSPEMRGLKKARKS